MDGDWIMFILKKHYKAIVFYITLVLIALILVVGVPIYSYGNRMGDEAINVSYSTDNIIDCSNLLTMSDDVGRTITYDNYSDGNLGYLEFEVTSKVDEKIDYEIYLVADDEKNDIPTKFVKVYLTDEKDKDKTFNNSRIVSIPTFYDLRIAESTPEGRLIYSGELTNKETDSFKLRMWVSDTYKLTADSEGFSAEVIVKVLQEET